MSAKARFVILLIMIVSLALRFLQVEHAKMPLHTGDGVSFTTTLSQEPTISGATQRFMASPPHVDKIMISLSRFPEYHYGNVVHVSGLVKQKTIGTSSLWTMSYPKISLVSLQAGFLSGFFLALRSKLLLIFTSFLSQIPASLLMGIVFGIKIQTPQNFSHAIQTSGLTHIIAASGMNVTMVAAGVGSVMKRISHRKIGLVLTLLAILFYVFLCGFQASIVRAAIMGSIGLVASLLGRQYTGMWALIVTGWLMVFRSPDTLGDVDFQLSFFATAGIITIKPLFDRLFSKRKLAVIEDITGTTAAQIATVPILLAAFGQYNLLSLVANALVLWMIPLLMVLGSLAALVGLVLPVLAIPFLLLSLPLLLFLITVIQFFGSHLVGITVPELPLVWAFGYYIVLGSVVWYFSTRTTHEKI